MKFGTGSLVGQKTRLIRPHGFINQQVDLLADYLNILTNRSISWPSRNRWSMGRNSSTAPWQKHLVMYMYSCPGWKGTWKEGIWKEIVLRSLFRNDWLSSFLVRLIPLVFLTLSSHSLLMLFECGLQSPLEPKQSSVNEVLLLLTPKAESNQVFLLVIPKAKSNQVLLLLTWLTWPRRRLS